MQLSVRRIQIDAYVSEETYQRLQQLTDWYNEWLAESPDPAAAPIDANDWISASITQMIRAAHEQHKAWKNL